MWRSAAGSFRTAAIATSSISSQSPGGAVVTAGLPRMDSSGRTSSQPDRGWTTPSARTNGPTTTCTTTNGVRRSVSGISMDTTRGAVAVGSGMGPGLDAGQIVGLRNAHARTISKRKHGEGAPTETRATRARARCPSRPSAMAGHRCTPPAGEGAGGRGGHPAAAVPIVARHAAHCSGCSPAASRAAS